MRASTFDRKMAFDHRHATRILPIAPAMEEKKTKTHDIISYAVGMGVCLYQPPTEGRTHDMLSHPLAVVGEGIAPSHVVHGNNASRVRPSIVETFKLLLAMHTVIRAAERFLERVAEFV